MQNSTTLLHTPVHSCICGQFLSQNNAVSVIAVSNPFYIRFKYKNPPLIWRKRLKFMNPMHRMKARTKSVTIIHNHKDRISRFLRKHPALSEPRFIRAPSVGGLSVRLYEDLNETLINEFGCAVCNSKLWCSQWPLQVMAWFKSDRYV